MKYECGVEYPTNGQEPDLLDDVIVEQYSTADEKWHKGAAGTWNWKARTITKFRIIDERYKPAEKPNALTPEASLTHSDSSLTHNWFERGELPQVGFNFEAYFDGDDKPKWNAGVVAYISDEHVILKFDDGDENYYDHKALLKKAKFRPIKTDKEKAIDAAAKIAEEHNKSGAKEFYGALYDAGLLRLPEGK